MISYNDHNKEKRIPHILRFLNQGGNAALVSDSGTPGISDPGYNLLEKAVEERILVSPVPGASAAISALISSGLPTDRFNFLGFLPKKEKKKGEVLLEIKARKETCIVYESPRIQKTLSLIKMIIPNNIICLAREITKKFEQFFYGTAEEIIEKAKGGIKGEIVLVIS